MDRPTVFSGELRDGVRALQQISTHASDWRRLSQNWPGRGSANRATNRVKTTDSPSRFRRRPVAGRCRQVGALDDRIQPPNLSISKTVDEVIVHHANRLHVRIDDGRTNEAESPAFEILAKRVRFT